MAAFLRERPPECPIVLITRGSLFHTDKFANAFDVQGTFDDVILKEDVAEKPVDHQEYLVRLIEGFRALERQQSRDRRALYAVLKATEEEIRLLNQAQPPAQHGESGGWRVAEAARWIRKTLLAYPGILYDSIYAASMLGIAESAFLNRQIQKHFRQARYAGPFLPPKEGGGRTA